MTLVRSFQAYFAMPAVGRSARPSAPVPSTGPSGRAPRLGAVTRGLLLTVAAGLAAGLLMAGCGAGTEPGESTTSVAPTISTGGPGITATTIGPSTTVATTGPGSSTTTASGPSTSSTQPGGAGDRDWLTYHHDLARSGVSADQEPLGDVRQLWTSATLDAPLYAQPLVVGDRVYAATEGNSVYALDAASGTVVWQTNLGEPVPAGELPCGNIDPSGITGTPVIDPGSAVLYAVANLRSGPAPRTVRA